MLRRQRAAYVWVLLLAVLLATGSCEKDDICVDGDTPLLAIGFFDLTDPEVLTAKEVSSLRIREINSEGFPPSVSDRSTTDSVAIPLPNNVQTVSYELISNSATIDDTETGNIDTLTITYTRGQRFVSRACGFVAVYEDITPSLVNDGDNWIQDIVVIDTTIRFTNRIHLKVLH